MGTTRCGWCGHEYKRPIKRERFSIFSEKWLPVCGRCLAKAERIRSTNPFAGLLGPLDVRDAVERTDDIA